MFLQLLDAPYLQFSLVTSGFHRVLRYSVFQFQLTFNIVLVSGAQHHCSLGEDSVCRLQWEAVSHGCNVATPRSPGLTWHLLVAGRSGPQISRSTQ